MLAPKITLACPESKAFESLRVCWEELIDRPNDHPCFTLTRAPFICIHYCYYLLILATQQVGRSANLSLFFFILQLRTSFCPKNQKMDPSRRVHERNQEICLKISQWDRKSICINTFCPNKQFDGGVFDWVSENFIILQEKLDLYIIELALPIFYGDSKVTKKRFKR